ncbi:protein of unknown function [Cyanobium sp. NIES-981]|nr:protein of unknown function [Cyanobium sp. NIES-981]
MVNAACPPLNLLLLDDVFPAYTSRSSSPFATVTR